LPERLKLWKQSLRSTEAKEYRAEDLYVGDHWHVVRNIAEEARNSELNVRIWVCSAGYGLIQPATPLKAYRATFTRGQDDYVASGFLEEKHTLHGWWAGVCSYRFSTEPNAPRSLSDLAAAFPRTPLVVALSEDYLKAVTEDLSNVKVQPYFHDHLSIVSCGTSQEHPLWKNNLLPCDASLARGLGGTLTSLNVRVARRLLQSLSTANLTIESLAQLARTLDRETRGTEPSRMPQSDSDVARFIGAQLAKFPTTSKTKLLGQFRGNGRACEQKRFGEIYSRVRSGPRAGANG
jgi:hypothetical protein